uniref:CBS domain-containing protein n=1 Tax=Salix viminalis TaxID=40686 RepID=A0A6N2L4E5_SALVM
MQESKVMDFRKLEDVMKQPEDFSVVDEKESVVSNFMADLKHHQLDPGSALQMFLDHIPISSIPGIKNSPVVELNAEDRVKDAIHLLYEKNVSGAPIADVVDPDTIIGRFSDRYVGYIDLAGMALWSLEECEKAPVQTRGTGGDENGKGSIFTMLEDNPRIGQAKVGELAKSYLWDPFFPVHLDDTLFHVLLLLSNHHRLQVVPVIDRSNFQGIGFVTQNAVIQLLLQSSGLEWFDSIADKTLSDFRFENEERVDLVYGDRSLAEALHILRESRVGVVAVVNRENKKVIGCIRKSDVYLLLENNELLGDRKSVAVGEFIHTETAKENSDGTIERDLGALFAAGALQLRNNFRPKMDSPVTTKRSSTLKQAMKDLAQTKSCSCFLVNDEQQPEGLLTLRDVIIQFAPPCIDSNIHGGGFFESVLEQTGCRVKNGTVICDH